MMIPSTLIHTQASPSVYKQGVKTRSIGLNVSGLLKLLHGDFEIEMEKKLLFRLVH